MRDFFNEKETSFRRCHNKRCNKRMGTIDEDIDSSPSILTIELDYIDNGDVVGVHTKDNGDKIEFSMDVPDKLDV